MCGVAAVFSYGERTTAGALTEALLAMRARMSCRGPDHAGLWVHETAPVGMAHVRLSVLDPDARANQPMQRDGTHVVAYNGEIYNFRALRQALERAGTRFHTDSDTEVLLQLFVARGERMLDDLRGMFAFVIWDARRQALFVARDPFGMKPLYVADDGRSIRIASEVKALLAAGGIDLAPDVAGHVGFLLWGSVPEPHTLYRGIRAIPAGGAAWIDARGLRMIAARTLRSTLAGAEAAPPEDGQRPFERALADSVATHLVADVDVGIFLSAGLDSSALALLASREAPALRSLTLTFDEYTGTPGDEGALAAATARALGLAHTEVRLSRRDFSEGLPRFLDRMDQPSSDGLNTYFLSMGAARAGMKVALSGLGADELLGGYPSFRQLPRLVSAHRWMPLPRWVGRSARAMVAPLVGQVASPKYAGLLEYGKDLAGAYLLRRAIYAPWEIARLIGPEDFRRGWDELHCLDALALHTEGIATERLRISSLEASHYMRNQLLRDTDWASMSHGVEVRTPFLDLPLWRVVARAVGAGNALGKPALRDLLRGAVPPAVLHRPKTGFTVPVREWAVAELGPGYSGRGSRGWTRFVYEQATGRSLALRPAA